MSRRRPSRPAARAAAILLAALSPAAASRAATPAASEPSMSHEEAQQGAREIRATIEGLHKALQQFFADRNLDPVMKYYENLVEYFSPSGQRETREQIRKRLLSHAPRVKDFRTQVTPLTIHVSRDIGWATCKVHEAYTFDGQAGEEDLVSTYILEHKPAGWRIVHEHQSLDMSAGESAPEKAPEP